MKKLLLLPVLLVSIASLAQTQVILRPSPTNQMDATVWSINPDENLVTYPDFIAAAWTWGGQGGKLRSFLQFDLSSIPVGATLQWARLSLYYDPYSTEDGQAGGNGAKLRRITSAWDASTVTWNTQPTTTDLHLVRLASSTTSTQDYTGINVTKLVADMLANPSSSFGFAIRLDTETRYRSIKFAGSDCGHKVLFPKLVIEYTTPGMQKSQVTTLSLNYNGPSAEMNIYPNPNSGIFNCSIKTTATGSITLKVIDVLGKTVCTQPVSTANAQIRIALPSVSAGTYFVVLQDQNSNLVSQQIKVN